MEVAGVEVLFDSRATAMAVAFVGCGIALGTVSGLTPGIHANNFALLLAAVASAVPGPPRYVAAAMLAAGTVHTFLDVVPALALGVPDPAMAASALPGHRLVLKGRGREALRLSALGSGLAVVLAVPLAVPLTEGMRTAYPWIESHLGVVLTGIVAALVLTEPTRSAKVGAGIAVAASGTLGALTLDLRPGGPIPGGSMLAPLFAGLFGAPVLLTAMNGTGIPPQDEPAVLASRRHVAGIAGLGTLAGAIVGYIPGVSSAIAATFVLLAIPAGRGARVFVVATSGVNTATAVFALFAFVALGDTRTGVLVAVDSVGAPVSLPLFLVSVGVAAAVGFCLVVSLGDRYLTAVGRLDARRLSLSVLAVLVALVWGFAGVTGVGVFLAATAVGAVPPRLGARRVSLMGVLVVPLVL